MQRQSITEFLHEKVYPEIDAVSSGLLDHLKPTKLQTSGTYRMLCPACGMHEAFHHPGTHLIHCPRKKNCGESTSLWDVMEKSGYSRKEIVERLCELARVDPPSNKNPEGRINGSPAPLSPGRAIIQATQILARKYPDLLQQLQTDRGYNDEQMATMRLGVYSSPEEVLALLEERGISREVAIAKGYILVEENNPSKYRRTMNNRVIGYWPHPDGDVRLWGRLPSGKGDRWNKKYMFADSLKKDTPYLFSMRKPGPLIAVEGTFDGWSIQFMGFWGTAIGQASINAGQAAFLAGEGITEVAHMVDGDIAGYEGGIVSIRNCEPAGIVTAIVPLGQGMDDPDALRKAGRTAEFEKLIASRMNAGEFLARMCHTYASESPPNISGIRKIHAIVPMLTPVSTKHWKDWSQTLGVSEPKDVASVRLLSSLVDGGFDLDEALALVLKRTGFRITLTQETVNG